MDFCCDGPYVCLMSNCKLVMIYVSSLLVGPLSILARNSTLPPPATIKIFYLVLWWVRALKNYGGGSTCKKNN